LPICTAHSKRSGEPCQRAAIVGGSVCASHGAAAPQVRQKALERLAALVDPAITRLAQLLQDADQDSVSLRAAVDLLDRAGFKPGDKLQLSGDAEQPLEIIISREPPPTS